MKTLKDIGRINTTATELLKLELKAEAVKDIKELRDTSFCPVINHGLVLWIKDKFNLTEEDLK